jgi:fructose-1,6-bisphosphatase
VIDSNFAVGSVFGIWGTNEIIGKTGRELIGACLACYGTRTTVMTFNSQTKCVEELTLIKIGKKEKWIVTNPKVTVEPRAKLYSFATKGIYDNPTLWKIYE